MKEHIIDSILKEAYMPTNDPREDEHNLNHLTFKFQPINKLYDFWVQIDKLLNLEVIKDKQKERSGILTIIKKDGTEFSEEDAKELIASAETWYNGKYISDKQAAKENRESPAFKLKMDKVDKLLDKLDDAEEKLIKKIR